MRKAHHEFLSDNGFSLSGYIVSLIGLDWGITSEYSYSVGNLCDVTI